MAPALLSPDVEGMAWKKRLSMHVRGDLTHLFTVSHRSLQRRPARSLWVISDVTGAFLAPQVLLCWKEMRFFVECPSLGPGPDFLLNIQSSCIKINTLSVWARNPTRHPGQNTQQKATDPDFTELSVYSGRQKGKEAILIGMVRSVVEEFQRVMGNFPVTNMSACLP